MVEITGPYLCINAYDVFQVSMNVHSVKLSQRTKQIQRRGRKRKEKRK